MREKMVFQENKGLIAATQGKKASKIGAGGEAQKEPRRVSWHGCANTQSPTDDLNPNKNANNGTWRISRQSGKEDRAKHRN